MACRLVGDKPLLEPKLEYCFLTLRNKLQWNINQNLYNSFKKMYLKMSFAKCRPFCLGLNVLNKLYLYLVEVSNLKVGKPLVSFLVGSSSDIDYAPCSLQPGISDTDSKYGNLLLSSWVNNGTNLIPNFPFWGIFRDPNKRNITPVLHQWSYIAL